MSVLVYELIAHYNHGQVEILDHKARKILELNQIVERKNWFSSNSYWQSLDVLLPLRITVEDEDAILQAKTIVIGKVLSINPSFGFSSTNTIELHQQLYTLTYRNQVYSYNLKDQIKRVN